MLFQKFFLFLRQRDTLLDPEIVMNNYGRAFHAEPAFLPGLLVYRKGLVPDAAYPGTNFHFILKKELIDKIIVRMCHNKGKVFIDLHVRLKNPEKRIPGGFKPKGQYRIIDVSEPVNIAEPGLYYDTEHAISCWKYNILEKSESNSNLCGNEPAYYCL